MAFFSVEVGITDFGVFFLAQKSINESALLFSANFIQVTTRLTSASLRKDGIFSMSRAWDNEKTESPTGNEPMTVHRSDALTTRGKHRSCLLSSL